MLSTVEHERPERLERDAERILQEAGVPLLRLQNKGRFDPAELSQQIAHVLAL